MKFPPTAEQSAIIEAARGSKASLMVSAYAGCAKTTSLVFLSQALPKTGSVLALAFNKKIKEELEAVLPSHFVVKTMNGLGHGAWTKALGRRCALETGKIPQLVTELSREMGYDLSDDEWAAVRTLVIQAKHDGLVPKPLNQAKALVPDETYTWKSLCDDHMLDYSPTLVDMAREVLKRSIKLAYDGVIDFDDQIYMSTMFMGVYGKFDTVLVDEAQDLSPLNHLQLKKSMKDRLIVVGDPKQAIYAFRGADSSSMEKIRTLCKDWIDLPLTLTFRCPKAIVARQHSHAPDYRAAPEAPEGKIIDLRQNEYWEWGAIPNSGSQAVICRNNAPILSLAFRLIKRRVGVTVLGRDIGRALKTLLKKICGEDQNKSAADCAAEISQWMEKEIYKARLAQKEEKVSGIMDRGESLLAVIDGGDCQTLKHIHEQILFIFEDAKGKVTLCTGHKAKGLEWDHVLHLDPWRIPSKWARMALEDGNHVPMQQEENLRYVIETRAKKSLALAPLEKFQ